MSQKNPWYASWLRRKFRFVGVAAAALSLYLFICWDTTWPLISPFVPMSGLNLAKLPDLISKDDYDTFATHAINNTVIIVPVNSGMLSLAQNMICSLEEHRFNTSSIVFWALDEPVQHNLTDMGFATYYNPTLFSVSGNQNFQGGSSDYYRMMRERPRFFRDFLMLGFDMLMLDADIVFWQSPLKLVPAPVDKHNVDIVYSTDAREFYTTHDAFDDPLRKGSIMPPICNGQFWMKSTKETIGLWAEMAIVFKDMDSSRAKLFHDDQRGIDVMLNDGRAVLVEPFPDGITKDKLAPPKDTRHARLRVQLLDQTQVVNGQLFMFRQDTYFSQLTALRESGGDRISVHMNWDTNEITKPDGAAKMNLLYVDEDGNCKKQS